MTSLRLLSFLLLLDRRRRRRRRRRIRSTMSSFGTLFRVTTAGESHAKGIVAIVDGVPPQMKLTESDIQQQLTRRRPGQSRLTTPRDEKDRVTIICGTERGFTLGTPVAISVPNKNVRPADYLEMLNVPRPGHADYTYQVKYGTRAASGGGRSSARETIGRVAAGAIAEKWLRERFGTEIVCWVSSGGEIEMPTEAGTAWTRAEVDSLGTLAVLREPSKDVEAASDSSSSATTAAAAAAAASATEDASSEAKVTPTGGVSTLPPQNGLPAYACEMTKKCYTADGVECDPAGKNWYTDEEIPVRCPDAATAARIATMVRQVKADHDSVGGTLTCVCRNVPVGLGEPCFDKAEAMLAHAMLSIPATKGFEIGSGFDGTKLRGSQHNDAFAPKQASSSSASPCLLKTRSNFAGGTLGGITSGQDIVFRVAVKPVSTIGRPQETSTFDGKATTLEAKGRHDPFVLPRAVPIVESMAALVLADLALQQLSRAGSIMNASAALGGGTALGTKKEVSKTVVLVNNRKRKR